jgi:hypothetical protein
MYKTFEEMLEDLGKVEVLEIVNRAIKAKEYQKIQHQKYNEKKKIEMMVLRELVEKNPELRAKMNQMMK